MGLHLIAVTWDLPFLLLILEVAFGLGMVIFVHELGHFLVAKWCGVKCEKFFLGFDIYGLKLASFKWGETEYGIGILPLGGYVKMLGQDDNPAKAAEERERSRLSGGEGSSAPAASPAADLPLDPRSYMAKSVPQRMAIISAGVIMNVIFAFFMAMWAFSIGVRDVACGVSATSPGEPAWKANLQPGDMITGINHGPERPLRYRDLMSAVALVDLDQGVDFEIKRPGVDPFWVNIRPDVIKGRMKPTIGVMPIRTTELSETFPVAPGSPAAQADAFKGADRIVAVNGTPVETYAEVLRELTRHPNEPLSFKVARQAKIAAGKEPEPETFAEISVAPRPMRTFGVAMTMGPITAVQAHSPAVLADLRVGDRIEAIDGAPIADPLWVPEQLRRKAGQTVALSILRTASDGKADRLEKEITLRNPEWPEESIMVGSPVSAPALGVTFSTGNTVSNFAADSPASTAEWSQKGKDGRPLAVGDQIVKAEFVLPRIDDKPIPKDEQPRPLEFSAERPNWPYLMNLLQRLPEGSKITFTLADSRTATLTPRDEADWFYPDRGLVLDAMLTTAKANGLAEAATMAAYETKDALLQVYAFIRKIGWQISPFSLGGPKTIAELAGGAAQEGLSQFLIFLTLLSANLAVLNFLPIPLLDGGHMVFLILEGILRRPVNDRIVVAFHYAGLIFIVSLMLFVLGLDFGVIPRPQ